MWASALSSPDERAAFSSLLAEYFQRPFPTSVPGSSVSAPAPHEHKPVQFHNPSRPSGLTTSQGRAAAPAATPTSPSFSTRAQNAVAQSALENASVTGSALRRAGVPANIAASASAYGASHSAQLAPHLAKAANAGWNSRSSAGSPPTSPTPSSPPAKGPKPPVGLSSSKSMAGGYDTTSGKKFTKSLFTGGGPMARSKVDAPYTGSLATHQPVKVPSRPPPRRGVPEPQAGPAQPAHVARDLGKATALYDYEGAEAEDLPVLEGEVVTVLEHVDESWWRCRNAAGGEGTVPSGYLQAGGA